MAITYTTTTDFDSLSDEEKTNICQIYVDERNSLYTEETINHVKSLMDPNGDDLVSIYNNPWNTGLIHTTEGVYNRFFAEDKIHSYINRYPTTIIRAWDGEECVGFSFIVPAFSSGGHTLMYVPDEGESHYSNITRDEVIRMNQRCQERLDFLSEHEVALDNCFTITDSLKISHHDQDIYKEMAKRSILKAREYNFDYRLSFAFSIRDLFDLTVIDMNELGAVSTFSDTISDTLEKFCDTPYGFWDCRPVV
jgi:hypothetical protein